MANTCSNPQSTHRQLESEVAEILGRDSNGFYPITDWRDTGYLKKRLTIGSEGGSAWAWYNGECIGCVGSTEQEAIVRTALAVLKRMDAECT